MHYHMLQVIATLSTLGGFVVASPENATSILTPSKSKPKAVDKDWPRLLEPITNVTCYSDGTTHKETNSSDTETMLASIKTACERLVKKGSDISQGNSVNIFHSEPTPKAPYVVQLSRMENFVPNKECDYKVSQKSCETILESTVYCCKDHKGGVIEDHECGAKWNVFSERGTQPQTPSANPKKGNKMCLANKEMGIGLSLSESYLREFFYKATTGKHHESYLA